MNFIMKKTTGKNTLFILKMVEKRQQGRDKILHSGENPNNFFAKKLAPEIDSAFRGWLVYLLVLPQESPYISGANVVLFRILSL